jgi:hypothetical protein
VVLLLLSGFWWSIFVSGLLSTLLAQLEVFDPSLDEGLYVSIALAKGGKGRQNHNSIVRQVVRLEIIVVQEIPEKVTNWERNPRSKCEMKTTLSVGSGAGTVSPAGSRHETLAGTHRVVVIQDMSARVTSDPSQPECP